MNKNGDFAGKCPRQNCKGKLYRDDYYQGNVCNVCARIIYWDRATPKAPQKDIRIDTLNKQWRNGFRKQVAE